MAKTKYETVIEPNLTLIGRWKRNGISEEEIAKKLGIAYSTFNLYKKQKSELSEVLKKGAEIVDTEVENALLKRALGYSYDEITKELVNGELKVTKIVHKQVVADTTAQIFWLKNRASDKWRDKVEFDGEVAHKVDIPPNIKGLSLDELRVLAGQINVPSTEDFKNDQGGEDK